MNTARRFFFRSMRKRFLVVAAGLALAGWGVAVIGAGAEEQGESVWTYDAKGRRDPFVPCVRDGKFIGCGPQDSARDTDFSKPVLSCIVWDPQGNSFACLNDTEVMVGDTVGEFQVAEIRQDAVVLMRDGEPVLLQIEFDSPPPPTTSPGVKRR